MKTKRTLTHWGAFDVQVSGNQVVKVHGTPEDRDPSPIGASLAGTLDDACRIRCPAVRKSYLERGALNALPLRGREPFVEVSWELAETLVADELKRVIGQHGNASIYGGSYGWASAGRFHHAQSQVHRFLDAIGGYTRSLDTYSLAAGEVILPHVLGDSWPYLIAPTSWDSVIAHTELFVAFGGLPLKNTQVHSGGMAGHEQKDHMIEAGKAGVTFISISPVESDSADFLDAHWIKPRPNTDVAIMLGIAHTLLSRKLYDDTFLSRYCVGHEDLFDYLLGTNDGQEKTAEWAANIAAIDTDTIVALALEMANKRTMISVSWSLTRQDHGEQPYWMAVALAAMLGQIGIPGGGVGFGYAAENKVGLAQSPFKIGSFPGLSHKVDSFIPVARIADMLLHPGEEYDYNGGRYCYPDIQLVYWAGGNPFHHHQDLNRLHRAWQKPATIVSHEIWWNSTARHADIVLPVTSSLERNDIGGASGGTLLQAMPKIVEPFAGSRNDFDIFASLSSRLEADEAFTEGRNESQWLEAIYRQTRDNAAALGVKMPEYEDFWEQASFTFPKAPKAYVMLEKFRKDPDKNPLATPSGRIEIGSAVIKGYDYEDCHGFPSWFEPQEWLGSELAAQFPLHLITNQPKTRLHSQLDNGVVSKQAKINNRESITINSADAKLRSIKTGDTVVVSNSRGAFLAGAITSDSIRKGVAQIATGAWWDPQFSEGDQFLCVHGNPNTVTLDKGTSRLAQGPSALSCLVEIKRFNGEPPDVQVFSPPEIQ